MTDSPNSQPSVLIVDRSADSREVLRTVLERRGVRILEAAGGNQGLELCRRHHPEVVVFDVDCETDGERVREELQSQADTDSATLVVLGTLRRCDPAPATGRFVPKPYHYAPLVRTIEELLDDR
jgi:CheY-like chemotaxis protein